MENVLNKPLKDLTDGEVLDLLDIVSAEVQRRNRLNGAGAIHDAVAQALGTFCDSVKKLSPPTEE